MLRPQKLLYLFLIITPLSLSAQNHKEAAAYKASLDSLHDAMYLAVDEWNRLIPPHNRRANDLEYEAQKHPEQRDSLLALAAAERNIAKDYMPACQARIDSVQNEIKALNERYALIVEDAFPYFRQRKNFTKDSLSGLLKQTSPAIRRSKTAAALRRYIRHQQLGQGDNFRTFPCYDRNGKRFHWRLCKGKKVLILHDGLWCMTHGRDNTLLRRYLDNLVSKSDFIPLIVVDCINKEELQAAIEEYGLQDFHVVSEFQKTLGKLNWLYNDTTTPTCHYIDEQGIIKYVSEGLDRDYLEKQFLRTK